MAVSIKYTECCNVTTWTSVVTILGEEIDEFKFSLEDRGRRFCRNVETL
jgi:hypothetical protein